MRFGIIVGAVLVVCFGQLTAHGGIEYRTVAVTGGGAPGAAGSFSSFSHPPVISDAGVAFIADVAGSSYAGIWADRGSGLQLVARESSASPGGLSNIDDVIINDAGQIATRPMFSLQGFGILVIDPDGSRTTIGLSGTPVPGVEGAEFHIPGFPDLADNGQVAFEASHTNPYNGGVWATGYAGGATPSKIAVEGMDAPGTAEQFNLIYYDPFVGGGKTVFKAKLSGGDYGLWQYDSADGLQPIVIEGQIAQNGQAYSSFDEPRINERGHIAVLTGWDGIVKTTDAGVEVVAWENELAPGTGAGEYYILTKPVINNKDQVAFMAHLNPSTIPQPFEMTGVWSEGLTDQLHLVAREGMNAPGAGDTFGDTFDATSISDAGYTAFMANLNSSANEGLWVETSPGNLSLVALEGQPFTVGSGDVRMIEDIQFAAEYGSIVDAYAHEHAFNANGEMIFTLDFTDGSSGIFVAAVPEPTTALLLALASLLMLARRRCQRR